MWGVYDIISCNEVILLMKKRISDLDIDNKSVIIRCDLNVPIKEGVIQDDTRIRASLKTINYCLDRGAKVIILSHLGKVKTEEDRKSKSLYPVSIRLSELLGRKVKFSFDTRSVKLTEMARKLKKGEVLLIENTRFEDLEGKKESNCDLELARYWASLGEVIVNDAYGTCHRSHASNVGICKYLPSCLGFLVIEEIDKLEGILNDETHPFIVIMGGAKVSDKIKVIDNLIKKCDKLLIGGGMTYTFWCAMGYKIGKSIVDDDSIDYCKGLLEEYKDKIVLPIDSLVSESLDSDRVVSKDREEIEDQDICLDIGPKTRELFEKELDGCKRVIMNGPMGMFEKPLYQEGTLEVLRILKDKVSKVLIGGGDTVSATNKLGFTNSFYHVSTGGGATLEYLEGKELPGIGAIEEDE